MIKVAVISSTGGAVMNAVLQLPYIRERVQAVISDRECGAIEIARANDILTKQFITKDALIFSDKLANFFLDNSYDLVISFYTKLFRGKILEQLHGKFINFHPSILPACPGMDGFGDTIKSGSRFIGSTVHLIDNGTDTGLPIIQSARPYNPHLSLAENRHVIFIAQCKMFIQVVNWYEEARMSIGESGLPILIKGKYQISEFAPNLDFLPAIDFEP